MREIKKGIVFSEDIFRILNGVNAFDYKYEVTPSAKKIKELRIDFKKDVDKIFKKNTSIISEDEMMEVNNFINGGYPHCNFG